MSVYVLYELVFYYTMCPRFKLFIVRSRILCVYMKATIKTYYYDYSSTSEY